MPQTPVEFVNSHINHELEYMLIAASTWCACHPDRRAAWPRHLVATAEYGAFVHQRNLFELFCETGAGAPPARQHLGQTSALKSELYMTAWKIPLNTAVSHMVKRWREPPPHKGYEQLKNQVATFAIEVIRLWRDFATRTADDDVRTAMRRRMTITLRKAREAAAEMGTPDLDWSHADPFEHWGDRSGGRRHRW